MNKINSSKANKLLGTLLLYFLIGYTFFMLGRSIWQNYQLKKEAERIRGEMAQITKENKNLDNLILYYQTDSYREVAARQKLGLKKPGETVVMVPVKENNNFQNEQQEQQQNIAAPEKKLISPNWQLWWNYFFK